MELSVLCLRVSLYVALPSGGFCLGINLENSDWTTGCSKAAQDFAFECLSCQSPVRARGSAKALLLAPLAWLHLSLPGSLPMEWKPWRWHRCGHVTAPSWLMWSHCLKAPSCPRAPEQGWSPGDLPPRTCLLRAWANLPFAGCLGPVGRALGSGARTPGFDSYSPTKWPHGFEGFGSIGNLWEQYLLRLWHHVRWRIGQFSVSDKASYKCKMSSCSRALLSHDLWHFICSASCSFECPYLLWPPPTHIYTPLKCTCVFPISLSILLPARSREWPPSEFQ